YEVLKEYNVLRVPATKKRRNAESERGCIVSASAVAGDEERLVLEPETAVFVKDVLRDVEVRILARRGHRHHFLEALVFDLVDVDGRVPRGEERRRPDAI